MKKSIPSFVLGLIGGILGTISGLCDTACAGAVNAVVGGSEVYLVMLLAVGGSILGLVGACLCFSKAGTGALMELIGAVMVLMSVIIFGTVSIIPYFVIALLAVGGLIGILKKA